MSDASKEKNYFDLARQQFLDFYDGKIAAYPAVPTERNALRVYNRAMIAAAEDIVDRTNSDGAHALDRQQFEYYFGSPDFLADVRNKAQLDANDNGVLRRGRLFGGDRYEVKDLEATSFTSAYAYASAVATVQRALTKGARPGDADFEKNYVTTVDTTVASAYLAHTYGEDYSAGFTFTDYNRFPVRNIAEGMGNIAKPRTLSQDFSAPGITVYDDKLVSAAKQEFFGELGAPALIKVGKGEKLADMRQQVSTIVHAYDSYPELPPGAQEHIMRELKTRHGEAGEAAKKATDPVLRKEYEMQKTVLQHAAAILRRSGEMSALIENGISGRIPAIDPKTFAQYESTVFAVPATAAAGEKKTDSKATEATTFTADENAVDRVISELYGIDARDEGKAVIREPITINGEREYIQQPGFRDAVKGLVDNLQERFVNGDAQERRNIYLELYRRYTTPGSKTTYVQAMNLIAIGVLVREEAILDGQQSNVLALKRFGNYDDFAEKTILPKTRELDALKHVTLFSSNDDPAARAMAAIYGGLREDGIMNAPVQYGHMNVDVTAPDFRKKVEAVVNEYAPRLLHASPGTRLKKHDAANRELLALYSRSGDKITNGAEYLEAIPVLALMMQVKREQEAGSFELPAYKNYDDYLTKLTMPNVWAANEIDATLPELPGSTGPKAKKTTTPLTGDDAKGSGIVQEVRVNEATRRLELREQPLDMKQPTLVLKEINVGSPTFVFPQDDEDIQPVTGTPTQPITQPAELLKPTKPVGLAELGLVAPGTDAVPADIAGAKEKATRTPPTRPADLLSPPKPIAVQGFGLGDAGAQASNDTAPNGAAPAEKPAPADKEKTSGTAHKDRKRGTEGDAQEQLAARKKSNIGNTPTVKENDAAPAEPKAEKSAPAKKPHIVSSPVRSRDAWEMEADPYATPSRVRITFDRADDPLKRAHNEIFGIGPDRTFGVMHGTHNYSGVTVDNGTPEYRKKIERILGEYGPQFMQGSADERMQIYVELQKKYDGAHDKKTNGGEYRDAIGILARAETIEYMQRRASLQELERFSDYEEFKHKLIDPKMIEIDSAAYPHAKAAAKPAPSQPAKPEHTPAPVKQEMPANAQHVYTFGDKVHAAKDDRLFFIALRCGDALQFTLDQLNDLSAEEGSDVIAGQAATVLERIIGKKNHVLTPNERAERNPKISNYEVDKIGRDVTITIPTKDEIKVAIAAMKAKGTVLKGIEIDHEAVVAGQERTQAHKHDLLVDIAKGAEAALTATQSLMGTDDPEQAAIALAIMIARKNNIHHADREIGSNRDIQIPTTSEIKLGLASMKAGILSNGVIDVASEVQGKDVFDLVSLAKKQPSSSTKQK